MKEETTVASNQPGNSRLGIGRPVAAPSQIPAPTPTDRLNPGQPEIARPSIGGPIASQLAGSSFSAPLLTPDTPLVGPWYNNDNSDPLDHNDRDSQSQTMISTAFTDIFRSEPHLHDIDGACPWILALEKSHEKVSKHRFAHNRREVVGEIESGIEQSLFGNLLAQTWLRDTCLYSSHVSSRMRERPKTFQFCNFQSVGTVIVTRSVWNMTGAPSECFRHTHNANSSATGANG